MKNQICLLTLLIFICYSFIQTNNEEIAGEENDHFGKAIKNCDLNSFEENLKKSGPLCNRNKTEFVMKLRNERDAVLCAGAESQALLAHRKNNSKLYHYRNTIISAILCSVTQNIIKEAWPEREVAFCQLGVAVGLLAALYDIYTDKEECKELDEKGQQLKARLDIFNAMIRLAEEHPAQ